MRSISSSSNRASLSYLLTFGIVAFTRYSIYPWLLLHIQARKYESWAQAVVSYGALLTFMNMGSAVGQSAATYSKQLSNSFFMVSLLSLTSSYISLAFVTRFAIMSMSMFSIGFSGALLSGFSLNLDTGSPSISFHRQNSEVDTNSNLERGVICFIFSTILSSILYDPRAFINYPAYYLALFLGAAFTIMMLYYLVLARAIAQKTGKVKVIGRSGGSNNSGLLGNGNSASMRSINNDVESEVAYTGDVPLNFLSCCRGDLNKARKMYGKMLAWRKQNDVDNIFEQPQRFFKEILEYYPHGIHGYSLDGCGVVYEVLGRGNPSGLAKTGIEIDELVWHFNIRNELVFNKLCDPATLQEAVKNAPPGAITITPFPYMGNSNISNANLPPGVMLNQPIPRLMTVIDVQGISITSVTTQVISFIKKSGEIIDNYYPEQVARLVVCRAPRWFSTIWTVIARVLPEAVQKKVDILYDTKGLDKYIHPSQRPKEYGGTDVDLGEWVGHKMFVQISENWKNLSANTNTQSNANPSNKKLSIQTDGLDGDVNTNTNIPTSTRSTASRLTSFLSSNNLTGVNNNNNAAANTNNSSNSVTPKSSGNNTDNSNNNNKGVMGWIVNRFTGGGNKPTTAYLGEKNSYRYNAASGMWELDLENFYDNDNQNSFQEDKSGSKNTAFDSRKSQNRNQSSQKASSVMHSDEEEEDDDDDVSLIESGTATATSAAGNSGVNNNTSMASPRLSADQVHKRKGRRNKKQHMTQEQIEEHGLVLAIQAAHFASQYAAQQQQQQQLGYSQAELGGSSPVGTGGMGGVRRGLEREYSDTLDNSSNNLASSTSSSGSAALNNTGGGGGSGSNNIWGVGLGANSGAVNSSNSSSNHSLNWHNQSNKLSSSIFLIAILLFVLTTSMQMMLTTLLPVWLCAPLKSGGLGYNVKDLGLQLSCTGLLVLHCHLFFSSKFDHILRASPVRALRIGCGWMCLSLFALPLYARWFTVPLEDVLHHSSGHDGSHHFGLDETEERSTALWRWHHHHMQAMLQEAESAVLSSLRGLSPTTSLASLLLCAVLITTLVCTAHLARRAAGILLHLVLSSVFQSPANIRHALYSLSDILGPLLSCVVYSVVYSSHIKFPLNSSFFFAFSASMAVLAYMLSIFLVVHFRGDYGVMSDYQDWRSLAKHYSLVNTCLSWCNNTNSNNSNSALNSRNSVYSKKSKSLESLGHKNSSQRGSGNLSQRHTMNNSNSVGDLAEERGRSSSFDSQSSETSQSLSFLNNEANDNHLLALPLGDINLLFSTVGQGYGSKLYNLKDDFKDV